MGAFIAATIKLYKANVEPIFIAYDALGGYGWRWGDEQAGERDIGQTRRRMSIAA